MTRLDLRLTGRLHARTGALVVGERPERVVAAEERRRRREARRPRAGLGRVGEERDTLEVRRRERLLGRRHHVRRGRVSTSFDVHPTRAEHQEAGQRRDTFDAEAVLEVGPTPDDQVVADIDLDEGLFVTDIDPSGPFDLAERAEQTTGPRLLEPGIEALFVPRALLREPVLLHQRRDPRGEAREVRHRRVRGPELVPAGDEEARPAKPTVLAQLTNRLEALTLDRLRVQDDDRGVELPRSIEAVLSGVPHRDQRTPLAQRLREAVRPGRVVVHHEDPEIAKDLEIPRGLVTPEEPEAVRRRGEHLVAERLGLGDQRPEPAHELIEGLREGPAGTQHHAHRRTVVPLDADDAGAELVGDELHQLVEGGLTELGGVLVHPLHGVDELAQTDRRGICAGLTSDHRGRAGSDRGEPMLEIGGIHQQRDGDLADLRMPREVRQDHAMAGDGVTQEQHEVGLVLNRARERALRRALRDADPMSLERLTQRRLHRIVLPDEENTL